MLQTEPRDSVPLATSRVASLGSDVRYAGTQYRGNNRDNQNCPDHAQRDSDRDLEQVGNQHFCPNEHENGREAVVEVMEQLHDSAQGEVERPQAQHGKNI